MGDVTWLPTCLDVPVENVLDSEALRECDTVVVVGWRDGSLYFASSTGSVAEVNMLLDLAKIVSLESVIDE